MKYLGIKDLITPIKSGDFSYKANALLRFCVSILFLGRAWKYYFFESSFREIFWNKKIFGWFVEGVCNVNWNTYLSNARYDGYIEVFEQTLGLYFLISAIAVLVLKYKKPLQAILIAAFLFQIPQAYFSYAGVLFNWPLLFEFSAQFFSPLILLLFLKEGGISKKLYLFTKVVIAVTFICHAYYALGIFKVPQSFYFLTQRTIGLTKVNADIFLSTAGFLDIIAAIVIFIPNNKLQKAGLIYMIFWGFFTALARPVAYFYAFDAARSLFQHLPDMLIRFPHFLLPLILLLKSKNDKLI